MINKDYGFFFLVLILLLYIFNLHKEQNFKEQEFNKRLKVFTTLTSEYKDKINKPKATISKRDMAVVQDPLYPPLDRNPRPLADEYLRYRDAGYFDVPTRNGTDTYRLMGYLINSTNKDEKWNIYGRQRYSGSSHGYFYATQQCNNNQCTKIELTKDILVGQQLNDFYNLPSTLTFNSPLFGTDPYDVVQLNIANGYNNPYY